MLAKPVLQLQCPALPTAQCQLSEDVKREVHFILIAKSQSEPLKNKTKSVSLVSDKHLAVLEKTVNCMKYNAMHFIVGKLTIKR
jgi:aromatic ring hydroxylase